MTHTQSTTLLNQKNNVASILFVFHFHSFQAKKWITKKEEVSAGFEFGRDPLLKRVCRFGREEDEREIVLSIE